MAFGHILAIVYHLHVLHVVRHEVRHQLIIRLGSETERTVHHAEAVVEGAHKVDRALTLDFAV